MPEGMFRFTVVTGVPVVTVPEELDITNAPDLRSALLEAADYGYRTLIADMTGTQFCDSSGLHTLLAAHKRALADEGELLLALPGGTVLRVFAITGIDHIIPSFTSLDEALEHARARGSGGGLGADGEPEPAGQALRSAAPADRDEEAC